MLLSVLSMMQLEFITRLRQFFEDH